jgi:antitoxin HicB
MEMMLYPATIEHQSDGRFFVQFHDFPDTFTEGETLEEALYNASEVLSGMLDCRLDAGEAIPPPTQNLADAYYIAPEIRIQAALLVRRSRGEKSVAELARALETSWPSAQRLENPAHWMSLRTLDRAAAAMGKRLVVGMI